MEAFLPQLAPHGIPVCISYTDDANQTKRVIEKFQNRYPFVTATADRSATNIDRKIVSAVSLACSRYVWLFGDDDLPEPGAVDRILSLIQENHWGMLVLNASSHDSNLSTTIEERRVRVSADRTYAPGEHESLLRDTASYATFIGGLVFEKAMWDSVYPTEFFGSDYVHVAVLYRAVVGRRARLVAEPQLRIRLATTTWASRYFEVELIHWPQVVWGLPSEEYSNASKAHVCQRRPTASLTRLLATRAYGHYGWAQYREFIAPDSNISFWKKLVLRAPLLLPTWSVRGAFLAFRRAQVLWGNPNLQLSLFRLKARR